MADKPLLLWSQIFIHLPACRLSLRHAQGENVGKKPHAEPIEARGFLSSQMLLEKRDRRLDGSHLRLTGS
ncbi:MAG: hypothetical protein VX085_11060, partial [Pseudomonadota bacterium]|nr:hypothetical protein [Pseudomonadota bacterium]